MDPSLFLARMIGPLFVLVGIGFLFNREHYVAMANSFLKNSELYYFSGALAFVAGMAMITFHNLWVADWRVVITVIGWMSLIKGIHRILFPALGLKAASKFETWASALSIGSLVLVGFGAWLSYQGFWA